MRRLAAILVLVASVSVVAVVGTGASDDDGDNYKVRAIFDTGFSVIKGEDVRVAGVTVGSIEKVEVTPDNKAAVVLDITEPGFADFRRDATCEIRPQSLIGERFVECTPTQPREPGSAPPPAARVIPDGQDGAGQHLVPLSQTGQQVDLDLVNNIMRLPFRERFSILLNEFGTGLAGRGKDLNEAIRRADPALRETNKVLRILAQQNRVLADLAVDSDTVLKPLADRRQQVADFIVKANTVSRATANESAALQKNFELLPTFLEQLTPTMERLGAFTDEATPVVEDLGAEAPALTRFAKALGPFSLSGIPALTSLGKAADVGTDAVPKTIPITKQVRTLAASAKPLSRDLSALLESFRDTGGIERLMDYVFFQVAAINGYDSIGHYLRAGLIVNTCSTYQTEPVPGCTAKFNPQEDTASARTARTAGRIGPPVTHKTGDVALDRTNAILARVTAGASVEDAIKAVLGEDGDKGASPAKDDTAASASSTRAREPKDALTLPAAVLPGGKAAPAAPAPSSESSSPASGGAVEQTQGALLDYLLGGDS